MRLAEVAALFADAKAPAPFEARRPLACHDGRWLVSDRRSRTSPACRAWPALAWSRQRPRATARPAAPCAATVCPPLRCRLRDRAVAVFGPMLTDAGYFLDTTLVAQARYKLFICEREVDAFDQDRSEFTRLADGGVWQIMRYELDADLLRGMDVFRLKHIRATVFVSDRFKALAEQHGLTGFIFEEIWSSDTGGVSLTLPGIPIEQKRGEFGRLARQKRQALRAELARCAAARTA